MSTLSNAQATTIHKTRNAEDEKPVAQGSNSSSLGSMLSH